MKVIFLVDDFIIEPLGIGYLSSVLKEQGHSVDLIKTYGIVEIPRELRRIRSFEKIVFAYSVTTGTHQYYIKLNDLIKTYFTQSISIFGGPHSTYFPEMLEEEKIDYILRGEGEKGFLELLDCIQKGESFDCLKVSDLIEDLDSIPFPDRELLYKYEKNRNNPIKSVMTMRGCPFSCTYCYNVLYKELYAKKGQKLVRFRGARNIVDECKGLLKYPLEMIYFQDDEFTANPNFTELMLLYKKEVGIPFHAQLRIDRITEEKVTLLKEAGCIGVTFAIESGSEALRRGLLNRRMSNIQILEGAALLKKHKMKFRTENMIGSPTETRENIIETLKLNIACNPDVAWSSIFQPYPNLELGRKCEELGLWKSDINSFKPSFFDKTELKFPKSHARFVNNIQKLFGVVCKWGVLLPFILFLCRFPENKTFKKFYVWYKQRGYNQLYRTKEEKWTPLKVMQEKRKLLLRVLEMRDLVPKFFLRS
jgi:anaerobic magnesium-protoporphyrin IX monomethyl ester cyclase